MTCWPTAGSQVKRALHLFVDGLTLKTNESKKYYVTVSPSEESEIRLTCSQHQTMHLVTSRFRNRTWDPKECDNRRTVSRPSIYELYTT